VDRGNCPPGFRHAIVFSKIGNDVAEAARGGRVMVSVLSREDLSARLEAAGMVGMTTAVWASAHPDKVAVYNPDGGARTFGELNANANRIVRLLRQAGLKAGEAVALLMLKPPRSSSRCWPLRTGRAFRITPVNWHLTTDEIAYIRATTAKPRSLIGDARDRHRWRPPPTHGPDLAWSSSVVGRIARGLPRPIRRRSSKLDGTDIDDPVLGTQMMYTSGTTGRPKGVYRANPVAPTGPCTRAARL
jgi:long-chain acyl-CoA synthetase